MVNYILDCGMLHRDGSKFQFVLNVDSVDPFEGKKEGYHPNYIFPKTTIRQEFDQNYYLKTYSNVVTSAIHSGAISTPFDHFMKFGICWGYSPSSKIDNEFYLENNLDICIYVQGCSVVVPHLDKSWTSGIAHYIVYGRVESIPENAKYHQEMMEKYSQPEEIKLYKYGSRSLTNKKANELVISNQNNFHQSDNILKLIEVLNTNVNVIREQNKLQKQIFEFLKETYLRSQNNMISTDDLRIIEENSKLYVEKAQKIIDQGYASLTYEQMEDIILGNINYDQ